MLEVGCGTGGFCEVAAARGASVSGIDTSGEVLAAAHARVAGGDFRAGTMERLPWADDTFDVVAGINAFQYADDIVAALAEARRVARPGGSVVLCKWGAPEDNDLFTLLGAVLRLQGRVAPAASAPDEPLAAMRRAGLELRTTGEADLALQLGDFAALESALHTTGGLAGPVARLGEEAVREALREAAAPFAQADGSYRLCNRYRWAIASA